jgi:hypothetical protein
MATGTAPAREPATNAAPRPAPVGPDLRNSGVAAFPAAPAASAAPAAKAEPGKEPSAARPERVVITSDQLVAAVQGKLQQAAEKAVHTAINTHLMDAVRKSLTKIDDVCSASTHQMEEQSTQRLESMMGAAKAEILSLIGAKLVEDRNRWMGEQEAYRGRNEELVQRIENLAAQTERNIAEMQKLAERAANEIEPQVHGRVQMSIAQATEEFDAAATRVADRQLVRLMEDKQTVTREAASQMAACAAEMRALLHGSASATLEECRRQMDVQLDLAISEATQRVMSSLASLDAENRAACEARRRSIESDVARAAEQSSEQFRSGMKAFLYSCLVAAVGAVDEHAKTTLDGLVKDQGRVVLEMGSHASGSDKGEVAAANDGEPQS